MKLSGRLTFAIIATAVGSAFQPGYNTGVVNAPARYIEDWIKELEANKTHKEVPQNKVTLIWSIAVSIFCVGGMVGGALTGYISERLGRKHALILNNILVLFACTLQGCSRLAHSFEMMISGRFFIGLNCGINTGLAPMYLSEISPVRLRGSVGTVYQLVLTISILISQILSLEWVLGTEESWPWLFAVVVLPAMVQVVTLPFCPESPKYLFMSKGREGEAQRALSWFRNTTDIQDEMNLMRSENESAKTSSKITIGKYCRNRALRTPLCISIVTMIAQQLSGINAVMFFSTKIFKSAGVADEHAQFATLGMGTVNVIVTCISLILVEKVGRKSLLLMGFGGMLFVTILLSVALAFVESSVVISYFCIILVLIFVIMFAIGPGSIPWFLVTELFTQPALPTAISIAVCANWTANFLVGLGFLPLEEMLNGYVFVIFVVMLFIFLIFVWKKVPETKNKTIEEITALFAAPPHQ